MVEICMVMILKQPFLCRAYFFSLNIEGTEKGALREAVNVQQTAALTLERVSFASLQSLFITETYGSVF